LDELGMDLELAKLFQDLDELGIDLELDARSESTNIFRAGD
jgi:membrane-bound lytic murein transglycosylase MltF